MQDHELAGPVSDFPLGSGRAVPIDGVMVAVFRTESGWHAIEDACPHAGAPLSEGHLEGDCVTCPWHAWRFSIDSGQWEDNPKVAVDTYEVTVADDQVWIKPND